MMTDQQTRGLAYMVSIHDAPEPQGALIFSFVPKGLQQERGLGGKPGRVPRHIALVRQEGGQITIDWNGTPDAPGAAQPELEQEIHKRLRLRQEWVARVTDLVERIDAWGKELGWSTRKVDKKLEDSRVGTHKVPALLLQEATVRVLLEPVSRAAPGSGGVVDLYVIPAYDDIASLYFREGAWYIHYLFPGAKAVGDLKDVEALPLAKEHLAAVLEEMKRHGE